MKTVHATNGKAQNNGIVQNVETAKSAPVAEKQQNPETEKPNAEAQKEKVMHTIEKFKPETLTAEGRITRMSHFEALSKRFHQLKEKSNDLKMYEAGNDKTNAKIIFKNSQGFEFEIRNTNVLEKCKQTAAQELKILLDEAENEVLTFEI